MSINLYGNVNGTYQPPNIDVFALAKAQNRFKRIRAWGIACGIIKAF